MTIDDSEKKLIAIFRKMRPDQQDEYIANMRDFSAVNKGNAKPAGRPAKKASSKKVLPRNKATAASGVGAKPGKRKKRGRPGRKKVDKKILKEKIDKLKMITRSINKITVR